MIPKFPMKVYSSVESLRIKSFSYREFPHNKRAPLLLLISISVAIRIGPVLQISCQLEGP